jgi:hypothetical protein
MSKLHRKPRLSRRHFLKRSVHATGILSMSSSAALVVSGQSSAEGRESNPFAYDIGQWAKTDPKLIHYQEAARFSSPRGQARRITSGPDGRLYLAAGNYVSILDRAGGLVSEIVLSAPVRCAAVATDGTLYVSLRDHVEVLDAEGQRRAQWESPGKRTWFTGLAVSENEVFATDAGDRVLLRYDRTGKLVKRIGQRNLARGIPGFVVPSPYFDVKVHRDGRLRVTNPGRHRVETYTVAGDLEGAWGKFSTAIEGFCGCCNPISIALLPNGSIVTCEKGLPRVKVYSIDGRFESVVAGTESFPELAKACTGSDSTHCVSAGLDAAVDAEGRVYILDMLTGEIRVMTRKSGERT